MRVEASMEGVGRLADEAREREVPSVDAGPVRVTALARLSPRSALDVGALAPPDSAPRAVARLRDAVREVCPRVRVQELP